MLGSGIGDNDSGPENPTDQSSVAVGSDGRATGEGRLPGTQQHSLGAETAQSDGQTFDESFSKSEFIANDFLAVIVRVKEFIPGTTQFTASLPRTRYGEILMEGVRQAGFNILLGPDSHRPRLSYDIDLPSGDPQNLHTFYVSVGHVHLKRSYEIVDDRIAPASAMLMAGLEFSDLRPVGVDSVSSRRPQPVESSSEDYPDTNSGLSDLKVPHLNRLLSSDTAWNPLESNMYESRTSVYEPLFADSSATYTELSSQILVFPNDSLILGDENKLYLRQLVDRMQAGRDVIRIIGCSHGKTNLNDGNQRLARGRAVRVREELLHAGVDDASILHEACWANQHFDEMMPRRGVVIMHLRDNG